MKRQRILWLAGLFLLHVLPFAVRPALIGGDEPHYALAAHSMAVDGDIALEDDYEAVEQGSFAAGRKRAGQSLERHLLPFGNRQVLSHPLGLPWLAVPLLWVQQRLSPGSPPDLLLGLLSLGVTFLGLLAGRELLARSLAANGLLRAGASQEGTSPKGPLEVHNQDYRLASLVAFGLYFSTPLWYYSRTFFTEPYLWAFPVLSLWLMSRQRWWGAGALLGLTFLIKETSVLLLFPILLGVLVHKGLRRLAPLVAGLGAAGLVYAYKNYSVYGDPWTTAYPYQIGDPLSGALGVSFSTTYGLVPFAPLAAVSLLGFWGLLPRGRLPWGRLQPRDPLFLSLIAFVSYFLVVACWTDPTGGASYGTRLLLPGIPALAIPLAALWRQASSRRGLRWLLVGAMVIGSGIQLGAALDPVPAMWSITLFGLLSAKWASVFLGLLAAATIYWVVARRDGFGFSCEEG